MSNFQDPQAHNTRGLKKFTGNKYKLGERVVSTCDRTIDGRSNALHQLPPKKHTRAPPTSKLFPSKLTLSGVIAVHDLFPRFWNACVLVLLSLFFSRVWTRKQPASRVEIQRGGCTEFQSSQFISQHSQTHQVGAGKRGERVALFVV